MKGINSILVSAPPGSPYNWEQKFDNYNCSIVGRVVVLAVLVSYMALALSLLAPPTGGQESLLIYLSL